MNENTEILRRLDRIERKLNMQNKAAAEAKPTETWAKVGFIQALTGWDREALRRARKSGMIRMRKGDNGIEDQVESIHPAFLRTPPPSNPTCHQISKTLSHKSRLTWRSFKTWLSSLTIRRKQRKELSA